jgi:hypothetical protein
MTDKAKNLIQYLSGTIVDKSPGKDKAIITIDIKSFNTSSEQWQHIYSELKGDKIKLSLKTSATKAEA